MKKLLIVLFLLCIFILLYRLTHLYSNQTLVLYYSNYCPHCRAVEKEIKKIGANVTMCSVDSRLTGICKKIAEKINLNYVPTLVVIRNRKLKLIIGSKDIIDFLDSNRFSFLFPPWRS